MSFFSDLRIKYKIAVLPVLALISLIVISGVDFYLFRQLRDMSSIFKESNKFSLDLTRHLQLENNYIQNPDVDIFDKIENNKYSLIKYLDQLEMNKLFYEYKDILDQIILTFGRHNFLFIQVSETVFAISSSQKKLTDLFNENISVMKAKIDEITSYNTQLMVQGKKNNIMKREFSNSLREYIGLTSEAMLNINELLFFSDPVRYENAERKWKNDISLIMSSCRILSLTTGDPDDKNIWRQINNKQKHINRLRSNIFRMWKRRQKLSSSLEITHNKIQDIIEKLNARVNSQINELLLRYKCIGNITIVSIFLFIAILSIVLIKHITKPIQALTASMEKHKNRDFNEPLNIFSNDEVGLLATTFNEMIQHRKQGERDLQESEAKFRTFFDFSPQPISLTEVETGRLIDVNERLCEIMQYSKDELVGRKTSELFFSEEFRSKLLKILREKNEVQGMEIDLNARDGSIINIVIFCRFIQIAEETYILTVWINVTQMRQLEMQLQQAQKMESIGTLAGGIAHDFNNILGVILGNAEIAIEDFSNNDLVRDSLQMIRKACLQARDIIRQILVFSRQSKEEKEPIKISQVIEESVMLLRSLIPASVEIKVSINSRSDVINASSSQINRILINLCSNAAYAMKERGGVLEIVVESLNMEKQNMLKYHDLLPGKYSKISIKDNGPGINPEQIEHIFEPYFTTKDVGEGSGMGLAVVHGIVKDHCGDVVVESIVGTGTTFEILFPCMEFEIDSSSEELFKIKIGKEHILFVDDDKSIVSVFQMMLERLGYRVTGMTDSMEALDTFRKSPAEIDLVITDMSMPGMNGVNLAKELLHIRADIPIILCTGYSDLVDQRKAREIGIREYIIKPLSMSDISVTIRNILDETI